MPILSAPVTLTAGATGQLSMPENYQLSAVVFSNVSPFSAALTIGATRYYLLPYEKNVFPVPTSRTPIGFAASAVAGTATFPGSAGELLAEWYGPGEPIAGSYPSTITPNAATPTSILLTQLSETIGHGTTFTQDVSPPAQTTALQFYVGNGVPGITVTVTGDQSGAVYTGNAPEGVLPQGITVPVNMAVDSSYTIVWTNTGVTSSFTLTIAALLSSIGQGSATCCSSSSSSGGAAVSDFFRYSSGLWYPASFLDPNVNPITIDNPGNQNSQYYPFAIDVAPPSGFDMAGLDVTNAGSAGDKVEVGVYADTGFGKPGARLFDFGSIDVSATGHRTLALSWIPTPGLYWLAILQLSSGNPDWQLLAPALWPFGLANPQATSGYYGYFLNGISALPASASAASLNTNQGGAYSPFLHAA